MNTALLVIDVQDNGVLKAPQISAHHSETLANISSFGPRARAVPASEVRIAT
jgi:hypothetical protein